MTQHTPGQWDINTATKEVFGNGGTICEYWNKKRFSPENEANARLIASAPELLEALKKAREILLDYATGNHELEVYPKALTLKSHQAKYMEEIEQAIAKAEGE